VSEDLKVSTRSSVKSRLLLLVIGPMALGMALLSFISYQRMADLVRSEEDGRIGATLQTNARVLEKALAEHLKVVQMLARSVEAIGWKALQGGAGGAHKEGRLLQREHLQRGRLVRARGLPA